MSSKGNSGNSGSSNNSYTVTGSGTNSQGNHYCTRDTSSGSGYHYSNNDGSYYYSNGDGSTYYNNGSGGSGSATYTAPNGNVYKK